MVLPDIPSCRETSLDSCAVGVRRLLALRIARRLGRLAPALAVVLLAAGPADAAIFTVTSNGASGPGTLRQAVLDANASPGLDAINFAPGVSSIDPYLAVGDGFGPLVVSDDLLVVGPGRDKLAIDGHQTWIAPSGAINPGLPCGQKGTLITNVSGIVFQVVAPGVSLDVVGLTIQGTGGLLAASGDRAGGVIRFVDVAVLDNAPISGAGNGVRDCRANLVDMGWGGRLEIVDSLFSGNKVGFETLPETGLVISRSATSIRGSRFEATSCWLSTGGSSCGSGNAGAPGTWLLRVYRGDVATGDGGTADTVDIRDSRFDELTQRIGFENRTAAGSMTVNITNSAFFEDLVVTVDVNDPSVRNQLPAYTGIYAMNADLSLTNASLLLPSYKFLGGGTPGFLGSHLNVSGRSTLRISNAVLHATTSPSLAPGERVAPLFGATRCSSVPTCTTFPDDTPVPGNAADLAYSFVDDPTLAANGGQFVGQFLYLGFPVPAGTLQAKNAATDGAAQFYGFVGCGSLEALVPGACILPRVPTTTSDRNPIVNGGSNALAVYPDGAPILRDEPGRDRIIDAVVDMGAAEAVITAKPEDYFATENMTLQVPAAEGVLANDLNCGTGPFVASLVGNTSHGSLSLAADGSFVYVPDPGYVGDDAFSYRIPTQGCILGNYVVTVAIGVRPSSATPTPVPTATPTPTPAPPGPTTTDLSEAFAQVSDRVKPGLDSWAARGLVTETPESADGVVSDGVAGGVAVVLYDVLGGGVPGLVDINYFPPDFCLAKNRGQSLVCRSGDGSTLRIARKRWQKDPDSFRISSSARRRDLMPHPYGLPLSFEVVIGNRIWQGLPSLSYCRVTQNGERTTCRLPRAG